MGKRRNKGNAAAQNYRRKERKMDKNIFFYEWDEGLGNTGSSPIGSPPPGYKDFENEFGRGRIKLKPIETPYDLNLSEAAKKRKFPEWYKNHITQMKLNTVVEYRGEKGTE